MARIAKKPSQLGAFKKPKRASLRDIGIPDGRDVLAVYFWWVKQRYYRAQSEMGPSFEVASSIRSVVGIDDHREPLTPVTSSHFWRADPMDLAGVGGQFD